MSPAGTGSSIPSVRASLLKFYSSLPFILEDGFRNLGDIVEVKGAPIRFFCFRHPDHIQQIYTQEPTRLAKNPDLMPRVRFVMGEGSFIHAGGDGWKRKRRAIGPTFSETQNVPRLLEAVGRSVDQTVAGWRTFEARRSPFDLLHECRMLITRFTLSSFFSEETDVTPIANDTHTLVSGFIDIMPLTIPTPNNIRFRQAAVRLQKVMGSIIAKHRTQSPQPADFVSHLLNSPEPATGERWPDDEIRGEMLSVYFGAGTMAVAVAWTLYMLSQHAEARAVVEREVDALEGQPSAAADLPRLPYLSLVFKETMRLCPPVWAYPRYANEPVEIGGFRIPAKSIFLPIAYFAHRHPDFWTDPEGFDPGRFDRPESKIHPFAYYPFGGGPRMCLGAYLAPLVCQLMVARLVQTYSIDLAPQFLTDRHIDFGFELSPKDKLMATIRRRSAQ
jgi:cytochrome P450